MDKDVFSGNVQEDFQISMKNLRMQKKEFEVEIQKRAKSDLEKRARDLSVFTFSDPTGT